MKTGLECPKQINLYGLNLEAIVSLIDKYPEDQGSMFLTIGPTWQKRPSGQG